MNSAWYQVLSLTFGYLSAAMAVLLILLAIRKHLSDRRLLRRVRKGLPRVGSAGVLRVLTAGLRRIPAGTEIRVPYEGTMGASHSCDVCIPYRRVHLRSAFFWMEGDGLHMVPLHRDGILVDDVPVEPGDEAVLYDGALLKIGEVKLALRLKEAQKSSFDSLIGPYVTTARRSRAQQGKGEGIGAPGRGEARREKKREKKNPEKNPEKKTEKKSGKKEEGGRGRWPQSSESIPAESKRRTRQTKSADGQRRTQRPGQNAEKRL